jgi:hypothetical protein
MKKFKLFSLAAFFSATLGIFMVACQKEETPTNTVNSENLVSLKGVTTENGRLKFSTKNDFDTAIKQLNENSKKLSNFEAQFSNFTSARMAFAKIDEEALVKSNGSIEPYKSVASIVNINGEKHLEPAVDSKYLGILANEEGILQIENTVYKFSRDYVYEFDASLLPQYNNFKNNIEVTSGVKKHLITRSNEPQGDRWDVAQCDKFYDSNDGRKVSTEIENNSYFLFLEAKARVINRKKGAFGLWYRKYTEGININGTFTVERAVWPNTQLDPVVKTFNDSSSWQAELHEAVGFTILGIVTKITGTATGNADPQDPSGQSWLGCTVTKQ